MQVKCVILLSGARLNANLTQAMDQLNISPRVWRLTPTSKRTRDFRRVRYVERADVAAAADAGGGSAADGPHIAWHADRTSCCSTSGRLLAYNRGGVVAGQ